MRSILITLLLVASALAQDEALSKRYHEAYVLEVIDGKPADAARAYLELLQEKKLPDRLRLQTEFRFAVTCVLLGRADEARGRLAALAKLEGLPEGLRAQVEEYRSAIADVKLGTALETNLQALTMKLAKFRGGLGPWEAPTDIYREFEVLGPRTVPYLRRVLRHRVRDLRWHAFQILARMDVPDLLELWDPNDIDPGLAVSRFVRGHPKRVAKLEQTLRGLKSGVLKNQLRWVDGAGPFSLRFIHWVATQPGCEKSAARALTELKDPLKSEPVVLEWMRSGRPELQRAAAYYYGHWSGREGTKKPADLFVKYCLLLGPGHGSIVKYYAVAVPPSVRLKALAAILDAAQADPDHAQDYLIGGLADALAATIDPEVGKRVDPQAYEVQLRRWLKLIHSTVDWEELDEPMGVMMSLRRIIVALPPERALRIAEESLRMFGSATILVVLGFERAQDIPLIRAALKHSGSAVPEALARSVENPKADPEYLRAVARLWPELAPWMGGSLHYPFFFQTLATRVPESEARDALLATVRAIAAKEDPARDLAIYRLFPVTHRRIEDPGRTYASRVLIPVLPKLYAELPRRARVRLAHHSLDYVHGTRGQTSLREDRERVAVAVLDALPDLGTSVQLPWEWMIPFPDLYPLERWARSPLATAWPRLRPGPAPEDVERSARKFAAGPSRINDSVALMLARWLPMKARNSFVDETGRKADARVLRLLIERGIPCSDALLEKRTLEFLADPKVDEYTLMVLTRPLVRNAPSPRLFPIVKRLLRSEKPSIAMYGMDLATSLGSEDLIPSIAPALDSMNAEVREKAKKSIESILDSRRIKKEIAERLGGG